MERKPLKSLVREALEVGGCLVEDKGEHLETLLPQDIAASLGLREHQLFSFVRADGQENQEMEFVSYDSTVLDNISRLLEGKGLFCKVGLGSLYLKQENLYEAVSRKVSFLNSIYSVKGKEERIVSYLLLNFRYSAVSEQKTEGIIPVIINEVTLGSPREMIKALARYGWESPGRDEMEGRRTIQEVYRVSCQVAQQEIQQKLVEFVESLNGRLARDMARLQEYYGALKNEALARIEKRGLLGEEKEREIARIKAIDLELARKTREQQERYSLRIKVETVNALRITLPVRLITLQVRRKDKEKELALVWNPVLKDVELPVCESCLQTVEGVYLCDERLHHICRPCYECSSCHKKLCHACHPHSCPRCNTCFPK